MLHRLVVLPVLLGACVADWKVSTTPEPVPVVDTDLAVPLDTDTPEDTPPATDTELPGGPTGDTGAAAVTDTAPPPPPGDCTQTSDLIYLLSRSDESLYLYDPVADTTSLLGAIDCTMWSQPASMGVSRDGRAFVRYANDSVYEVDLATLDCSPTAYNPGRTGFGAFGMGYATRTAGTWVDDLYVANHQRISRLDTQTWTLSPVATLPSVAELTGTGGGELWAFLPLERPARLQRIHKTTGQTLATHRLSGFPAAVDIDTFAFAAWSGRFYLFVRTYGVGSSSDILQVDAQGRMTTVRTRIGIDVVGAGTSTCAPI